jgi:hypothetical protein
MPALLTSFVIGYVQNPYAEAAFTPDQRRAQEAQANSSTSSMFGSDNNSSNTAFGVDTDAVWNSAKNFMNTAGRKLSQAEQEIWKKFEKD